MQIRCNFPDISYLNETQKNNFQFLNENISNERQHVEKVKFLPTKLPIYQRLTITDYQTW